MVDRNLQNFHGRIGRIERIHDAGGGFEAEGALGMSFYRPRQRRRLRRGFLGPLVLILMTVIFIKSSIHASLGAEVYGERISALQAGSNLDRIGAYVLQADPLTLAISAQVRALIH